MMRFEMKRMNVVKVRVVAFLTALALGSQTVAMASSGSSSIVRQTRVRGGEVATFYSDGHATLADKNGKIVRRAFVAPGFAGGASGEVTASRSDLLRRFVVSPASKRPYKPNTLIVVFQAGAVPLSDRFHLTVAQLRATRKSAPAYSSSLAVNRALESVGTDSLERIASHLERSRLHALHAFAQSKANGPLFDIADAYRIHVLGSNVENAVRALRDVPGIVYASPDYYVSTMQAPPGAISDAAMRQARDRAALIASRPQLASRNGITQHQIPTNYAVSASAQSLLNAPGVDAIRAYDEVETAFNQLPGAGELVANVSIGDVSDNINKADPCYGFATSTGPTTHLIDGQHYIDWPSLPLIPAYVVDSNGNASGTAEACAVDPTMGEIGLDFSVMAPLPHQMQRGGEVGSGYADLFGIAPGAHYELFVPQEYGTEPTTSDIVETFLAAALSPQRPDVITASIGFGYDVYGFPGRFFEDDPLSESAIATIVNGENIVVCLSANDGTRTYTPAAIGPSGGSAATNRIRESATPSDLGDLEFTTLPSSDYDSGSIDVGGTTLDDIFADPLGASGSSAQLPWPETRWTGFANFSSGFGTRVDVSAPSDNILAFAHNYDGNDVYPYDSVNVTLNGGTSASAPETAATIAVVLQVARLTGRRFASPSEVRAFLASTGRTVQNVPQADQDLHVGPQIDLGKAVETLLQRAGKLPSASVPRVAIAQRRAVGNYGGAFVSDTAPSAVDLAGPALLEGNPTPTGEDELAPITIAPDWEGLPRGTKFTLSPVTRPGAVLATTAYARLLPEQILHAAGLPLVASSSRNVELAYTARVGARVVSSYFDVTFGPAPQAHLGGFAPKVAPVTSGDTMQVTYDLTDVESPQNAKLVVSEPGRQIPTFAELLSLFHPAYTAPLHGLRGTVSVPVRELQGSGVYGVTIEYASATGSIGGGVLGTVPSYTNFAFTRIVSGSSAKASPVLLSSDGNTFWHTLYPNYNQRYQVRWDVSNVPNATGALLEIGSAGPSLWGSYNTFNNPNGSIADNNGVDSRSLYTQRLSGKSGTLTLDSATTLTPALANQIRVIPLDGTQPVGEASDTSLLAMYGFTPPDGNPLLNFTFGDAGKGVVATDYLNIVNDVYPVDDKTGAFEKPLLEGSSGIVYDLEGTVFSGNLQVVSAWNLPVVDSPGYGTPAAPPQYGLLNLDLRIAPGEPQWGSNLGSHNWFPITSNGEVDETQDLAYSRQGDVALFALLPTATAASNPTIYLATSTLPRGQSPSFPPSSNPIAFTLGTQYNATAAYHGTGGFESAGVVLDQSLNEGLVEVNQNDPSCSNAPSQVSTISLTSGAVDTFNGGGHGYIDTTTYDPGTHTLAAADECGDLILTNAVSHATTTVPLPIGETPFFLSADTKHHLLLVGDAVDPAYLTNNDAGSIVYVYNDTGKYLKTITGFEFNAVDLPGYLELDESTRRMFLPELTGMMVEPATY
jgi:hypothetical protein